MTDFITLKTYNERMSEQNILVTGAGGFLGPWLCERLIGEGKRVFALDIAYHPNSRIHEIKDLAERIEADVNDYDQMLNILRSRKIEIVFHLAAQALVGVALNQPYETLKTNILGTMNILEAARYLKDFETGLKAIIVASSDKAYGDQDKLPYIELAPMQGKFPYDVSKSCADLISRSYFYTYKVPVCVTRCGNMFGGGDLNWSRLIPGTIFSCIKSENPPIRSDGTLVRDYVYVQDVAEALSILADKMIEDKDLHGMAFNISNDSPKSVLEVVRRIIDLMARPELTPVVENTARAEIAAQYLSSSLFREKTGWSPRFDFESGLKETIKWYEAKYK